MCFTHPHLGFSLKRSTVRTQTAQASIIFVSQKTACCVSRALFPPKTEASAPPRPSRLFTAGSPGEKNALRSSDSEPFPTTRRGWVRGRGGLLGFESQTANFPKQPKMGHPPINGLVRVQRYFEGLFGKGTSLWALYEVKGTQGKPRNQPFWAIVGWHGLDWSKLCFLFVVCLVEIEAVLQLVCVRGND